MLANLDEGEEPRNQRKNAPAREAQVMGRRPHERDTHFELCSRPSQVEFIYNDDGGVGSCLI
jgi:hypothetical protein